MNKKNLNLKYYNQLWQHSSVQKPQSKCTWGLVKDFEGQRSLEIGCGNNPIIPLRNAYFLDVSQAAVNNLKSAGLKAYQASAEKIPFQDSFFNLVVAWHILEHVGNDQKAFSEISRVLKRGGYFLFASPIWEKKFTEIDTLVGHKRRYEPKKLAQALKKNNLRVLKYQGANRFLSVFFNHPLLLPFTAKIYQHSGYNQFFGLPKFLVDYLMRSYVLIEKMMSPPWQPGEPENLEAADNLVLFCQKEL